MTTMMTMIVMSMMMMIVMAMTMMMTPTHGKRHTDSIANRYRPATETLSYLNAWTEKQSVPPTQSPGQTCVSDNLSPPPLPISRERCVRSISPKQPKILEQMRGNIQTESWRTV